MFICPDRRKRNAKRRKDEKNYNPSNWEKVAHNGIARDLQIRGSRGARKPPALAVESVKSI